jgi:hypothetical protein
MNVHKERIKERIINGIVGATEEANRKFIECSEHEFLENGTHKISNLSGFVWFVPQLGKWAYNNTLESSHVITEMIEENTLKFESIEFRDGQPLLKYTLNK